MFEFLSSYGTTTPMDDELFAVFIGIYMGAVLISLGFSLVMYILQSLGMYKIAKRRGINNPWLSWIPVGNLWVLGSVSDQYQYVVKGKITNRRKVLLGVALGEYGAMFAMLIVMIVGIFNTALSGSEAEAARAAGFMVLGMLLMYFAMFVLLVIVMIFTYIALYDLYVSCNPSKAVLFLVLSIFIPVTQPFFVFACRNKDDGMPPRKVEEQPQSVVQQPVVEPVFAPVVETAVPQEPVIFSDEGTQQ